MYEQDVAEILIREMQEEGNLNGLVDMALVEVMNVQRAQKEGHNSPSPNQQQFNNPYDLVYAIENEPFSRSARLLKLILPSLYGQRTPRVYDLLTMLVAWDFTWEYLGIGEEMLNSMLYTWDNSLFPHVKKLLKSPFPKARVAGTYALVVMDPQKSIPLLKKSIRREKNIQAKTQMQANLQAAENYVAKHK